MTKLKNASRLVLSLLLITFFSCENEPLDPGFLSQEGAANSSLVGTWNVVSFSADVISTTNVEGVETVIGNTVSGSNLDYSLVFAADTFETNGSYDVTIITVVDGNNAGTTTNSLSNVSGSGNYVTDGNIMRIDGSFFDLSMNGTNTSGQGGEQEVAYTISEDGQTLTFTQNDTQTELANGIEVISDIVSSSVWVRTVAQSSCDMAINTTAIAEAAYSNNPTSVNLCNTYSAALQNQILACGDVDGMIQATLDELGNCTVGTTSPFAMTFKINGLQYNLNNPFGNNESSATNLFSAYPFSDYILLQSRNSLFGSLEIDLWIKRSHLVAGTTYQVNPDTFETTTHIDLIDNNNTTDETTVSGSITIDFVDPVNKIVRGTFEFNCAEYQTPTSINQNVTEGTFEYVYI